MIVGPPTEPISFRQNTMEGLAKIQAKPYAKNDRLRVFFCVNESLFRCDLHQNLLNSDRSQKHTYTQDRRKV